MNTPSDTQAATGMVLSQDTAAINLVPSLNANRMLSYDAPANRKLLSFLQEEEPSDKLSGKRIAILATDGVEEIELTVPYRKLQGMGAQVDLIAPRSQSIPQFGIEMPVSRESHILTIRFLENAGWFPVDRWMDEAQPGEYDAVIVPGGAWNPDLLRNDPQVLDFLRAMSGAGKVVAAICHGPQVLISAGLVAGKRATIWWSSMVDLENAGAEVLDEPVVMDDPLITSRGPLDLPDFLEAVVGKLVD